MAGGGGNGGRIEISLKAGDDLSAIRALAGAHGGEIPLHLKIVEDGLEVFIETSYKITADDVFLNTIRKIAGGEEKVRFY